MSKHTFYAELVKALNSNSLSDILGWMQNHGSSLILNYGEDNNLWECSWIIYDRTTAIEEAPIEAVKSVLNDIRTQMLTESDTSLETFQRWADSGFQR